MQIFSGISVRWKIYCIAIVSIIGFGGYLGFNVWINTQNTHLLTNVRDTYFPILEKTTTNGVRLERMGELFNTAVLTGELEYIQSAEKTFKVMNKDFDEILALENDKKDDVLKIQTSLNEYYQYAKGIAEEMAIGEADMSTLGERVKNKEESLKKLEKQVESFRQYAHQTFSGNIDTANKNSEFMLTSGFIIWISSIFVLTATVYAIARLILSSIINVSKSLHSIALSGDVAQNIPVTSRDEIGLLTISFNELMDKLRERTNDLTSMMQNMHQGLFTIAEDETIHKEHSAYIEKIFQTQKIAGTNYSQLLFSNADIGSDQRNQIETAISSLLGSDEMMFSFNQHLLVNELKVAIPSDKGIQNKILELDWDPIISNDEIKKIMVTVRDVTEIRAMQLEAEEQKRELDIIGQILKITPTKFNGFMSNAATLLNKNKAMIEGAKNKSESLVADLFVNMHTIKGNARTYQFSEITDVVHEAETTYDRLRKESTFEWNKEQLLHELELVRAAINNYATIKADKLSATEAPQIPDGCLIIKNEDYQTLLSIAKKSESSDTSFTKMLQRFDTVKFTDAIKDLVDSLPSVAQQLNKPAPQVHSKLADLHLHKAYSETINNVFTHLLRNAIDHGIESPEQRQTNNKTRAGNIYLEADTRKPTSSLSVFIWDDGQGVNLQRLKAKALESGSITESELDNPQAIANCLFMSGVSTAEKVTAISGRGVGMDAVKKYLQQLGCDIRIIVAANTPIDAEYAPFKLELILSAEIFEIFDESAAA
ncbi:MAG: HAMP domain-containing protein [Marinagarivorans sp.]|nr:HAMP domain-containing protein [Marinagarivorans sp.]